MNQFLEVAVDAAREAGALLLAESDRPKKITYKGEVDIVTESDRRSEAIVVGRLRRYFPQHEIVAEEGSGGPKGNARYRWHVDPLDGTTNFAHGYPCFAVSIGLLEDGDPIVGVVFNPVSGEMFTAIRGEGAYLNQKQIHVSPIETLAQACSAQDFRPTSATSKPTSPTTRLHLAFARGPARRFRCARSLLRRMWTLRSFLGVRLEILGYSCRNTPRERGRRNGH